MNKTFSLILPAIGGALIAVLAQFSFAIGPVPITLQTFAVGLIATLFHRREAILSAAVYLFLGAIGLPVFAGGSGGFQALIGPSAGYLWGYLFFAAITASLTKPDSPFYVIFFANFLGDLVVFIGGVISLQLFGGFAFAKAVAVGVTPFILPDLLKLIAITVIAPLIFRGLRNHPYFGQDKNG